MRTAYPVEPVLGVLEVTDREFVQIASFLYGHDCLDDLMEFQEDPMLNELMGGETPAARTMGDFLRDFEDEHLEKLNLFLSKMSYRIRQQMIRVLPEEHQPSWAVIMDIDSTDHPQCGEKMEGVTWNYKNHWCLDSQVVYDELGLCDGMQLRPGNTKSGVDAPQMIRNAFSYWKKEDEKYLRADWKEYLGREKIAENRKSKLEEKFRPMFCGFYSIFSYLRFSIF